MSVDREDFKPMPERCTECGRLNVWRAYAWESKVCDECAEHMQDEQEEA